MAQKTPHTAKEDRVWSEEDQQKAENAVRGLHDVYQERLSDVQKEYSQAQRKLTQLSHEIGRLERHIERMAGFCTTHNISLEREGGK